MKRSEKLLIFFFNHADEDDHDELDDADLQVGCWPCCSSLYHVVVVVLLVLADLSLYLEDGTIQLVCGKESCR